LSTTITLGANTYTLIRLPAFPGFSEISVSMLDSVALVESPYVPSQAQEQAWPGADRWAMQLSLPKMTRRVAAPWIAFLAAMRGRQNVIQVGDPLGRTPAGFAKGAPVIDGTITGGNAVSAVTLCTRGWTASVYRQLLPGDYLQVGSRLHLVCAEVDADASGKAQISVWPSLRETPADAAPIILANSAGVFRLASNQRQWHASNDQLVQISFSLTEAR
jgi:hypothetical protein